MTLQIGGDLSADKNIISLDFKTLELNPVESYTNRPVVLWGD